MLAACSTDGSVMVLPCRALEQASAPAAEIGALQCCRVHGAVGAGACAAAFDAAGAFFATGGRDGSLFIFTVASAATSPLQQQQQHLTKAAAAAAAGVGPGFEDAADAAGEQTLLQLRQAARAREATAKLGAARRDILAKVEKLRARAAAIVARNESAGAAEEKLSQEELVVDVGRLERERKRVAEEAAEVAAQVAAGIARDESAAARIKAQCWDAMEVRLLW